ncbi:hypothetical protein HPB51_010416 [Rhipicephalus microplus]|uniref:Endonuclease/exonuclease/phosphatase domain-containing protein n=1 Tax=Rhipicephalus microplus TaxID=6941 RepID=A0A9J6E7M3_RHIMP|nr:hypothetical protein HPB51_010416 [Rhipicephalus microplus]
MLDLVERRLEASKKALTAKRLSSLDITIEIVVPKIMEKVDPLTRTAHEIEDIGIKRTIAEIIPTRKTEQRLYLANLYSPPPGQLHQYDHFVYELHQKVNGNRLVIVGDINAPHAAWGYHNTTKKGARVHDAPQQHGLTLWNGLLHPTRVGNSMSRNTNPDLTFTRDAHNATWTRLPDTLENDYHITQIEVEQAHRSPKTGKARLTDWTTYRNDLEDDSTIEDIEAWLNIAAVVAVEQPNTEASKAALLRSIAGEGALDVFNNFQFGPNEDKNDYRTLTVSSEPSDDSVGLEDEQSSQDSSLVTDGELFRISDKDDICLEDRLNAQDSDAETDRQFCDSTECAEETPADGPDPQDCDIKIQMLICQRLLRNN